VFVDPFVTAPVNATLTAGVRIPPSLGNEDIGAAPAVLTVLKPQERRFSAAGAVRGGGADEVVAAALAEP
jgi:hypothetical protein